MALRMCCGAMSPLDADRQVTRGIEERRKEEQQVMQQRAL
jgi:hypothetical protein